MPAVATAGGLPTRLGKYEILTPLAAGGMARIYIARTTGIGSFERHVVLKLITPERANDTTAVQMFLDEARLAASLNHQNVAQVFEVGEDQGIHYLAMEYVHGQDLRALLAKAGSQGTRVPLELALTVVAGAAAGLGHAHERRGPDGVPLGIVHRDVSPSNIMIGYDGSVKLLDFGIAKATARSVETQSGIIKGKFAYMAPEQCRGRDVDQRSDVFSLGIILYEVSTQHRCFRADSDFDTMHRIVTGDVVRPTRLVQGYPQALEAIVMKALAVDINQRYQCASALLEAIESFSVASRMSLSTMSLGRFMRDMFGEQPEPWLTGRHSQPFLQPPQRESTISNTNGSGEAARATTPVPLASQPDKADSDSDSVVDVGSSVVESIDEGDEGDEDSNPNMQTILDMPRDLPTTEAAEQEQPEWNAKAYRELTSTPTPINTDIAALVAASAKSDTVTVTPGAESSDVSSSQSLPTMAMPSRAPTPPPVRASTPPPVLSEPAVPREPFSAPTTGVTTPAGLASTSRAADEVDVMRTQPSMPPAGAIAAAQPAAAMQTAAAMQPQSAPISHALAHAFATPGSGSGPSHPALAVPPHGSIPGAPGYDHGYPRYDGPEPSSELQLQPNRRPMIIGAIIIGFGLLVILAVSLGGEEAKPVARSVDDPSDSPGSAEGGTAESTQPSTDEPPVVAPVVTPDAMAVEAPVDAALAVVEDESIHIKIDSDPQGANVMLAGKIIGTTPLDTQVPRQATTAYLVVSRAEYTPEQKEIDLRSDYNDKLVLKKVEPAKHEPPKPPKKAPAQKTPPKKDPVVRRDPPRKDPPKKDPPKPAPKIKCVKAGTQNPFEPQMCDGKPCPICK